MATSASCGSLGSGVLSNDCSDRRADLIVRTGDHAVDSVSRQIAPYSKATLGPVLSSTSHAILRAPGIPVTHRLTADIGMPDLGLEFHNRWSERVFCRDLDIDIIATTFVWGPRRARERATQMGDILVITHGVCQNLRAAIRVDISQLFRNPTRSIGSHQPMRRGENEKCCS